MAAPNIRTLQRSFAGGEIAPLMLGRIDDAKYQNGARKLLNFISRPQGPASRRPGFQYVGPAGTSDRVVRLVPFDYSNQQAFAVELGSRTIEEGTTVIVDSTGFSVSGTPWSGSEFVGYYVECGGSIARVTANTTSQATIDAWSPATPASGSTFIVYSGYARFHTAGQTLLAPTADAYVANFSLTDAGVSAGADTFTFGAAHGFADNTPVEWTLNSAGSLPGGISEGVTYYVALVSPTVVQMRAEPDGPAIGISSAGSGTFYMHRAYLPGDLAEYGGATWYCVQRPIVSDLSVVPSTNPLYWFQLPLDGAYEVPTPFGDLVLPMLTFAQKNDVLRMTQQIVGVHDLKRFGAARWSLEEVEFGSPLAAPTGLAATSYKGRGIICASITNSGGDALFTVTDGHGLASGDSVRPDAVLPGEGSVKFYVVSSISTTTFKLRQVDDGSFVAHIGGGTPTFRLVDISVPTDSTYVVTALDKHGIESDPSGEVTEDNLLAAAGAYNTLTWNAVEGAERYRVYRKKIGLFGLLGETEETTFRDEDNLGVDMTITPPKRDGALTGVDAPNAVAFFQGRCCFGGTYQHPQRLLMTRTGTDNDLSFSLPTVDDDRILRDLDTNRRCEIRHIVPLQHLVVLTDTAEIRVTALQSDAVTPTDIAQRAQTYIGASPVSPVVANSTILFAAARDGHLRELGFSGEAEGYVSGDVSIRASHLFDGYSIADLAYQKAPFPVVWAVSSSGKLLGLTYVPEERIAAWHQHTTDGTFLSVCAIPDGAEDRLYAVIEREGTKYIERMAAIQFGTDLADAVFLDFSVTETSDATGLVSNLEHLAGLAVYALVDGAVSGPHTVTDAGTIRVAKKSAAKVHVGLPYASDLVPPPVSSEVEALAQGRPKNVAHAAVRVDNSCSQFQAGPDESRLRDAGRGRTLESTEVDVLQLGSWSTEGTVVIRQSLPLPLTVVCVTLRVAIGG